MWEHLPAVSQPRMTLLTVCLWSYSTCAYEWIPPAAVFEGMWMFVLRHWDVFLRLPCCWHKHSFSPASVQPQLRRAVFIYVFMTEQRRDSMRTSVRRQMFPIQTPCLYWQVTDPCDFTAEIQCLLSHLACIPKYPSCLRWVHFFWDIAPGFYPVSQRDAWSDLGPDLLGRPLLGTMWHPDVLVHIWMPKLPLL